MGDFNEALQHTKIIVWDNLIFPILVVMCCFACLTAAGMAMHLIIKGLILNTLITSLSLVGAFLVGGVCYATYIFCKSMRALRKAEARRILREREEAQLAIIRGGVNDLNF